MRPPSERHRIFAALYPLQRVWEWLGYARHRRAVARGVTGRALEIGVGTGFSFPYYETPPVVALDHSLPMVRRARARAESLGLKTAFVCADAAALPFASAIFDTVVSASVFCSLEDPVGGAGEVARVLRRDGRFRCFEHGIASRPLIARAQRLVAPVWRRLFGGCRIDRDPVEPILAAGFIPEKVRRCSADTVARGTFLPPRAEAS